MSDTGMAVVFGFLFMSTIGRITDELWPDARLPWWAGVIAVIALVSVGMLIFAWWLDERDQRKGIRR